MNAVIFAGPSISHQRLRQITSAGIAPPVRRGDLDRYARYDVFLIIDGEFGQNLSVSPKEILGILNDGKIVIGAASMGALRASELDVHGMIGIGWVYQHFASAAVRRDDDVALAYSPLDLSPVTIPMIDIEYWVTLLENQHCASTTEKRTIVKTARRIFYAERTESKLTCDLEREIGPARLQALLAYTSGAIPDIKHVDAIRAVEFLHSTIHAETTQ